MKGKPKEKTFKRHVVLISFVFALEAYNVSSIALL
jgi:hypothetical protein